MSAKEQNRVRAAEEEVVAAWEEVATMATKAGVAWEMEALDGTRIRCTTITVEVSKAMVATDSKDMVKDTISRGIKAMGSRDMGSKAGEDSKEDMDRTGEVKAAMDNKEDGSKMVMEAAVVVVAAAAVATAVPKMVDTVVAAMGSRVVLEKSQVVVVVVEEEALKATTHTSAESLLLGGIVLTMIMYIGSFDTFFGP